MELAFVVAPRHLPPGRRAVPVLRDVLGYRTSEVAAMTGPRELSVRGSPQRARAALRAHPPADRAPQTRERELAGQFADAMEHGDIRAIGARLTGDAWLSMPPDPRRHRGHVEIFRFLARGEMGRGTPPRAVPTR